MYLRHDLLDFSRYGSPPRVKVDTANVLKKQQTIHKKKEGKRNRYILLLSLVIILYTKGNIMNKQLLFD